MRTTADFFDLARKRHEISDYKLSKELEISRQYVSQMRSGSVPITEPVADKLGSLLDMDGGLIYAESRATRAKRPEIKHFWEHVARSCAASLLAFGVFLAPSGEIFMRELCILC